MVAEVIIPDWQGKDNDSSRRFLKSHTSSCRSFALPLQTGMDAVEENIESMWLTSLHLQPSHYLLPWETPNSGQPGATDWAHLRIRAPLSLSFLTARWQNVITMPISTPSWPVTTDLEPLTSHVLNNETSKAPFTSYHSHRFLTSTIDFICFPSANHILIYAERLYNTNVCCQCTR